MKTTRRCLVQAMCAAGLISTPGLANANTLQLSQEGSGEVLIFPYYTVRNGTLSLLSLVNQTASGKALRLRVRESFGGRPVAELNLFLSPKDVWTAAIVPSGDAAAIISNDKSCTFPAISGSSTGLVFSNAAFVNDTSTFTPATLDRVREGYLEVIEMATLVNTGLLARDVTHFAGTPACKLVSDGAAAALNPVAVGTVAPSGGVVGSMSFINLADGLSVSYNATGINGFWKTGPGAPVPAVSPVTAATPDLTSGANTTVTVTDEGKTYVSTFARSIDAVSALFMASTINGEYGFTSDGVFSNAFVVTFPTKPYYVHSTVLGPFQRAYSAATSQACDDGYVSSVDREEFVAVTPDDFPERPPSQPPPLSWCSSTNVYGLGFYSQNGATRPTPTAFDSPRLQPISVVQNQGLPAPLGKEGGHVQFAPLALSTKLVPTSTLVLSRSESSGTLVSTPVNYTYFGLPMIGFALSVGKYNTGSPQQNFGNLNPLTTQRSITTP